MTPPERRAVVAGAPRPAPRRAAPAEEARRHDTSPGAGADAPERTLEHGLPARHHDGGTAVPVWAVVDDFTRENPWLMADRSLSARRVIEALEAVLLVRPAPRTIVCDNGREFTSLALNQWASARGIILDFIRPGHPVENCFIESFNGKLRDECLKQHHFDTPAAPGDVARRVSYAPTPPRPQPTHPRRVRRALYPRGGALLTDDTPIMTGPTSGGRSGPPGLKPVETSDPTWAHCRGKVKTNLVIHWMMGATARRASATDTAGMCLESLFS